MMLAACKMMLKKIFGKKDSITSFQFDPQAIIGERCVVIEKVSESSGSGLVKVKGTQWAARGYYADDVYDVGEVLRVVAVEGVRLICRK